ncbi:MAG: hypothetical protein JK586_14710 [Nocardiopsis sp. BM-2018]|nr:MAG: hypothetical protein JK586_14710 [Nocardiopsis sp. BM-2018]
MSRASDQRPRIPARERPALVWALFALLAATLLPAGALVAERMRGEDGERRVAIVMDEIALAEHAAYLGRDVLELGRHYQALGLGGIALYEDTVETAAMKGRIAALLGREAYALAAALGEPPPPVAADSTLVRPLEPGAAERLLGNTVVAPQTVTLAGETWYAWPGDSFRTRPAGADRAQVEAWYEAGFEIAYRPRNFPGLQDVGADYPPEARYLVYAGLQVAGHPSALTQVIEVSQPFLTAIIEGTPQDGMPVVAGRVPTARLLSFNQDHLNQRLRPAEVVEKYLLAANERNVRIFYLRPYTEEQLGDMLENTEALVSLLRRDLEREGFSVGGLTQLDVDYVPNPLLRAAAGAGVVIGLLLLALAFPAPWGLAAAALLALLALVAAGPSWAALALVAAIVFPVLGFALLRHTPWALLGATGLSLVGATLLVAVGSDRASMLAIEPFVGVAATLVLPPALIATQLLLRWHRPATWVRRLWGYRVRLGDVAVALVVAAVLALVVIRRGNVPILGATEAELALRSALNELFVRPRFKELIGHPLAVLALLNPRWPAWATGPLLVAGVIAQASILNSFSHYHTPVVISLQRTLIALVIGVLVGLVLVPLARAGVALVRAWLSADAAAEGTRDA